MGTLYQAARKRIRKLLLEIYPEEHINGDYLEKIHQLIEENLQEVTCSLTKWDEADTVLISYANSISSPRQPPLQTLHAFLKQHLINEIRSVHILPFFPYSSDDGFSVIDYYQVDPKLGNWQDIGKIGQDFDLMADLVINHVSTQSQWFQNFLKGESPGKDYFIVMDPETDLSGVTRPRSTSLLTRFQTRQGEKHVWTTFSSDQVDLDFSNPQVLYEMLKVLFFYINRGIRIIRLDAIAYLWKEVGTSCIHLPQTHRIIKLFRELAELIHPDCVILTETNVSDNENLSYFGNKGDEAHMIYQSPLPPLILYTLHTGSSKHLTQWAREIPEPGYEATYFNFTASHTGIGVRPAEGLIPGEEMNQMVEKMKNFGGHVSTKTNADGSESPYEINITYFDALKGTYRGEDDLQSERFLCSQTIMMSLRGIPGFYIHSLTATENDHEGDPAHRVFSELKRLMGIRISQPAFHPDSPQEILNLGESFFAIKRIPESGEAIWSLSNITDRQQDCELGRLDHTGALHDLISGRDFEGGEKITLEPYQTVWLI